METGGNSDIMAYVRNNGKYVMQNTKKHESLACGVGCGYHGSSLN